VLEYRNPDRHDAPSKSLLRPKKHLEVEIFEVLGLWHSNAGEVPEEAIVHRLERGMDALRATEDRDRLMD